MAFELELVLLCPGKVVGLGHACGYVITECYLLPFFLFWFFWRVWGSRGGYVGQCSRAVFCLFVVCWDAHYAVTGGQTEPKELGVLPLSSTAGSL